MTKKYGNALGFVNPYSTRYEPANDSVLRSSRVFAGDKIEPSILDERAVPQQILEHATDSGTLYIVRGGDSTIGGTMAAAAGIVTDDFEASRDNIENFKDLFARNTEHSLLLLAGGNANNIPRSARTDKIIDSTNPNKFDRVFIRPLTYEIKDENNETIRYGAAASCFGVGAAALAATRIEEVKAKLKQHSKPVGKVSRWQQEARASYDALLNAPYVGGRVTLRENEAVVDTMELEGKAGFEMVGTEVYAKTGKTKAPFASELWQVITPKMPESRAGKHLAVMRTAGRLALGCYDTPPVNMRGKYITIEPALDISQEMPFHVDGDVLGNIEPGQSVELRLSEIAIPTLVERSRIK